MRGLRSVTVHGPSCVVAGSAATIAMLLGEREGLRWLESLGLPSYAIRPDGSAVDRFAGGEAARMLKSEPIQPLR